jgi:hypothetical protein
MSKTDPNLRDSDPYDVSLAELQPETAEHLAIRHRYLQLGDLQYTKPTEAAGIYVCGFPTVLTITKDRQIDTYPLGYVTTPLQKPPEDRDKDKDLLLYYEHDCCTWDGKDATTPEPEGLSGCGIWQLSAPPRLPKDTDPSSYRLVGIQHRWRRKSRYLVGTLAARLIEVLWRDYPELHSALRLVRSRPDIIQAESISSGANYLDNRR